LAQDAVVWYVPASGVSPPAPVRAEVQTRERRFVPRITVVPAGSEVWFPNSDPILHNVFSVSTGNRFDLGLYRQGPGKAARIAKAGLVRVYCNVHQAMSAFVLALDTPYVARPSPEGRFTLDGLPPGEGTLFVWHERANVLSRTVMLPHESTLALSLELRPAGALEHLDKNGRPYREHKGNDEYR
jgi:plastocyanin